MRSRPSNIEESAGVVAREFLAAYNDPALRAAARAVYTDEFDIHFTIALRASLAGTAVQVLHLQSPPDEAFAPTWQGGPR